MIKPERMRLALGGHEKFTFRYGWLKKGMDAILENPEVFSREDAFVLLGVGKNMASSIRNWLLVLGLCENSPDNIRRLQPTLLGKSLLNNNGWDPYLEDIGSLWLLHWQLASNPKRGLIWYLIFSRYYDIEFRKFNLIDFIKVQLLHKGIETTEGMIEREIDVFIRTYVPAQTKKGDSEESLDCPLVDLGLIRLSPGEGIYRFDIGPKPSLPKAIAGYTLLSFLDEKLSQQHTITFDECVYSPGSPGQVFKLDENSMIAYLEDLETFTHGAIGLQETAGSRLIYIHGSLRDMRWDLLRDYYD